MVNESETQKPDKLELNGIVYKMITITSEYVIQAWPINGKTFTYKLQNILLL